MDDSVYYQRRLAEELAAAGRAECAEAAAAHWELAEIYRLLVGPPEGKPKLVLLRPELAGRDGEANLC